MGGERGEQGVEGFRNVAEATASFSCQRETGRHSIVMVIYMHMLRFFTGDDMSFQVSCVEWSMA